MSNDFKQAAISVFFISVVLAGACAAYYLWRTDVIDFTSVRPAVPYSVRCDRDLLASHGIDPDNLPAVERALRANAKDVRNASMSVDVSHYMRERAMVADPALARFSVELFINDGCRLQSRLADVPWRELDSAMAAAIERVVGAYFKISRTHDRDYSRSTFINL